MHIHEMFESHWDSNKKINKTRFEIGDFNIGDPVIITGNVQFQGKTGDVRQVGRDGAFVVVDLYNYGPYSFHASDVSYNDYADSEDENVSEGRVKELGQDLEDPAMSDEEFATKYGDSRANMQRRAGRVQDRKTGRFYDPEQEFDRLKNSPEFQAQMKRMSEGYPKHQDLSGISTDKLKAYLDKQSKQQVSGEGNQVKRVRAELQRRQQGVAEAALKGTAEEYAAKAQAAEAKYLKYEDLVDQELQKLGQRLPQSWDAAKMHTKLSSHPKYALALKYYTLSEKFANQAIRYEQLAKKQGKQGVAEGPTDDPRFQRMMTGIQKSTPELMTGYVALNFASEQGSKKIRGVTQNGQPIPGNISNPDQLLKGNIKFTPDQIETKLRSIGAKYGWDSIDVGQGRGFTEMFFDTDQEYTSINQSKLAANVVKTVAEINKFFTDINKSLQTTGLPGYTAKVWQGMGTPENINQIQDLNQIAKIAKTPAAADESADPGPELGEAILSRWAVVADDDLGYTDEEIQQLLDVANVYITKGERAGLQAQLNSDVSELIDELLSDTGAYRLRTIPYDDLDETDNSLNEFALDDSNDPTEDYPCYDCGSTIFLHHTKLCDLAEPNAKRDLPAEPGTQYWTGEIPKGLAPIPGLAEGASEAWWDDLPKKERDQYFKGAGGKKYNPVPKKQGVAEEEKVGNMPADRFDSAMARLKQLAGAGSLKTVWDPQKRVYKNVPDNANKAHPTNVKETGVETEPVRLNPGDGVSYQGKYAEVLSVNGNNVTLKVNGSPVQTAASLVTKMPDIANETVSPAYQDGYNAGYRRVVSKMKNPYKPDTKDYQEFERGFHDGDLDLTQKYHDAKIDENITPVDITETFGVVELAEKLFQRVNEKYPDLTRKFNQDTVGNAVMDIAERVSSADISNSIDSMVDEIADSLQVNSKKIAEGRKYFATAGTTDQHLRKKFGLTKDRRGWYLSENAANFKQLYLEAKRTFTEIK